MKIDFLKIKTWLNIKFILLFPILFISFLLFSQNEKKLPNVIIILADDLGIGDLSCYGFEKNLSPNLDTLAQNGMLFKNFYSNSPVCTPTRAALLSGKYASSVGIRGMVRSNPAYCFGDLQEDILLMPQYLKKKNYKTGFVGKWNLGLCENDMPNKRGFDYYAGFLDDMVDNYCDSKRNGFNYLYLNESKIKNETNSHISDLYKNWYLDFIDKQNTADPFFLMVSLNMVHQPIQPKNKWIEKAKLLHPNIQYKELLYKAFVLQMDNNVGELIERLKIKNLYQNSIIIFLSDNGASTFRKGNNGNLRGSKPQMHEGGIRIPFILSCPKINQTINTNNNVLSTIDVLPTILDLLEIKATEPLNGNSFLSSILKPTFLLENKGFFCERLDIDGQSYAYRKINWKLILDTIHNNGYELYNLKTDPTESNNVINEFPEIANIMKTELQNFIQKNHKLPYRSKLHAIKLWNYKWKLLIIKYRNKLLAFLNEFFK